MLELFAQPTTFNYQAVVRNTDGSLITSQDIQFRVDIVDDQQNNYYTETHNIQTNTYGQVSVEIGGGDAGLLAQEVQHVFPEAAFQNPSDGFYGINYSRFSALFVEAFKEQQAQITELMHTISKLKKKLIN